MAIESARVRLEQVPRRLLILPASDIDEPIGRLAQVLLAVVDD
jgi:hypothetical protein